MVVGTALAISASALVLSYVAASFVLLRKPSLLHAKKKRYFYCRHISHRGGAGENLENTMTAFRHALACGTDMLELDCQLTADGEVVISHDDHLQRVADVDAWISDLPYSKLPPLKASLNLDFNKKFFTPPNTTDRRIPRLRELYEECGDIPVNVDIKVDNDELVRKVSELTKEFNREHLTVWGNFRHETCRKCYEENPNIHRLFSLRRVLHLILLYYSGLLPFVPLNEGFLEIVMPSIFLNNPNVLNEPPLSRRIMLHLVDRLLMNKKLFTHLQARGIQVYVWVLNSDEEFRKAFDELGADGVMTDFPTKLAAHLESAKAKNGR